MTFTDLTGTIGVTILLIAYFLNLVHKIKNDSLIYLILNFAGAAIACLASILLKYWPFIILEGCWTIVSAAGILSRIIKAKNNYATK
ncbi:MAG TPA: hypothetical protein VHB70_11675 [Parafilimonas sp.]|nr:hypothetical protein [Parafilimonas sp.]